MNNEIEELSRLERESRAALQSGNAAEAEADRRGIETIRARIERKPLVDGLVHSLFAIPLHFFAHFLSEIISVFATRPDSSRQK